jgi:hypothetical protein
LNRADQAVGVVVMVVVIGGFGYWWGQEERAAAADPECAMQAQQQELGLDDEQMANAATIAEVGLALDMPERAVVVAIATAMQESRLRNVDYGDRDSLGLFQQRPSQGWGSEEEVQDPEYAARAFYRTLRKVDGWRDMRVTDAAQRVQRSAFPDAYQKWAEDADLLATALLRCDT